MSTPEGKVKAKVKKALNSLGAYSFMPVQSGLGASTLDYICCVNGHFIGIETKAPGKKMTPRQEQIAEAMRKAGALVYVVDGDMALSYTIEEIRLLCQ